MGRYEVLTHLATGGMAQIYLARQSGLGAFERHVVLKTILRERAQDQRFVTMFLDEAKLAATLNHQNIAQVYEVDQADGAYFMAMEYVHGENARAILETTLRRGWTIPLELAVMIVSGAAAGLHHAHERRGKNGAPLNIVHRDVSPANVMVGYDGSVKVLDFGIAKAEERATKTVGGTIKGKYGYMSPEQCKGKPIDRRSDIFALGICLYELTTLRRAFKGNDDFETMKRIVAGDVILPSVAVPGYPRELEAIVLTAMANDVNARFQNGQEMIEALDAFAVRAKLTGSNTAMGRFMIQLFGNKREPWVEGGGGGDRTQLTEPSGEMDVDNDEKTTLIDRDDRQPQPQYQLPPEHQNHTQQNSSRALTTTNPGVGRASGPVPSLNMGSQPSEWQGDSRSGRQQPAQQQQRPVGYNTPPNGNQPIHNSTGPLQAMPPSGRLGSAPQLRADTSPGKYPLVDEASWGQQAPLQAHNQHAPAGGATRLPTQFSDKDYVIKSRKSWLILVLLMLAGLGVGALIAWQNS